ncbi:VWA domain-containing protein [Schleiferiaceae bacterium]|nr:VWA domain-containing protein [Schleiferiaceae bacterium]
MKRILILFGLILPILVSSQNKDRSGFYTEPQEFSEYQKQDFLDDFYQKRRSLDELNFNTERTWTVYSDRDNNSVYDRENGFKEIGVLEFMEPLFVKELRGSWLHVYSKKKKDLGWISVEYLLICRYAILNSGTAAPKKAMALISLDEDISPSELENSDMDEYKYYSNPSLNNGSLRGKSDKFKIYFVLKETPTSKLLSLSDKLSPNGQQSRKSILGWMQEMKITDWDTRVCLEPTTIRRSVQEYAGSVIPVFPSEKELLGMYNRPDPTKNAIMKNIVSDTLLSPYIMRMPILENLSYNNKKVATVGKIDYQLPNQDKDVNCLEEISKLEDRLRNVNIVFVIDGTSSMNKFYPPVANSITQIMEDPSFDIPAKIKFGAVIYRDYADGTDAYNVYPLDNDHSKIKNKLLFTKTFSNREDRDLDEAQYNAIINGLDRVGFKKGESNLVVLIGDAGNHDPDPKGKTIEKTIDKLKDYDVNFISFQVIQGKDFSYLTYNMDSKTYIEGVFADRKTEVSNSNGSLDKMENLTNTYQYIMDEDINVTNLYGFGRFTYANINKPMSTNELKLNIIDAVMTNLEALQSKLLDLRSICGDGTVEIYKGGKYEEELLRYAARRMSENSGQSYERCLETLRNLEEFSFVGYTSKKFYQNRSECYENVVYMSQTEFYALTDVLDRLSKQQGSNRTRKSFQEALTIQVKSVLGSDIDEKYIQEKTLEEVWQIILNLPFDENRIYGKIGSTKLKDLVNASGSDFDRFYQDYMRKVRGFGPAKYEKDRSFKMGGTTHYWVPLNDFPGNG